MKALAAILKLKPECKIITLCTLNSGNTVIGTMAMTLGASDHVARPSVPAGEEGSDFYNELVRKMIALARPGDSSQSISQPSQPTVADVLNPHGVRALAIASSTGGPQALMALFEDLRGHLKHIPIFITQHMPPSFTNTLANNLTKAGGRPCHEARDGEKIVPGHIYIAPGDYHMLAERNTSGAVCIRLTQDEPENFCRPAADPMLRSLSAIYGAQLAVVVLTGMGHDGMLGCKEVVAKGGGVVAQDAATSVVYGMPKAVADEKLCKAILPLREIGRYLAAQIDRKR
jgi:two-component system chemotaxis response regulator CheB